MNWLFKPSISHEQGRSQATPLAEDYLKILQGQIASGKMGTGLGPLQQEAGTAIRQYVNSGAGGTFDRTNQFKALTDLQKRSTDIGAADLRESFGAMGGRFGTGLANAEGSFRAQSDSTFNAKMGDTLASDFQAQQTRYSNALNQEQAFGEQNTKPFEDMAKEGIMPETIIQGDSPFDWVTSLLASIPDFAQLIKQFHGSNRG